MKINELNKFFKKKTKKQWNSKSEDVTVASAMKSINRFDLHQTLIDTYRI